MRISDWSSDVCSSDLVAEAHRLGLHVILDWVANHTAWDNPLVKQHPDWYERDWQGHFRPTPWWDWSDIIDLDYQQPGLRKYMTEAMTWWVREVDIDGFRCEIGRAHVCTPVTNANIVGRLLL